MIVLEETFCNTLVEEILKERNNAALCYKEFLLKRKTYSIYILFYEYYCNCWNREINCQRIAKMIPKLQLPLLYEPILKQ